MSDEQQLEWLTEPRQDGSIGGGDDPAYGWVDVYEWQAKFTWQLAQIKALTEKLDKAVAALEAVEWVNGSLASNNDGDGLDYCPWCWVPSWGEHKPVCKRESALAAAKGDV